ncbi:unnamed protein product [Coregonus sp. 'balchen']|nr:unnamed protein product [Coregonus sp. 'balchen']
MEAPVTPTPLPSNSTLPTPFPLHRAVAPAVRLGFTVLYTALYGSLFLVVYVRLWLLLLCRHKRWSYQSVFLFLCLHCSPSTSITAWKPITWPQCFTGSSTASLSVCSSSPLSLINLYFTQVLLNVIEKYSPNTEPSNGLCWARCLYATLSGEFLCVNVVCAALGWNGGSGGAGAKTWSLVLIRGLKHGVWF